VALPARAIATADLEKAGLPDDVALSLSKRQQIRAEFCVIEELEPESGPKDQKYRQFSEDHIVATIEISALFVAQAQNIVMAVARDENSKVKLVGLTGKP
jgi:hypothetical protein